jgi:hypothetical protein
MLLPSIHHSQQGTLKTATPAVGAGVGVAGGRAIETIGQSVPSLPVVMAATPPVAHKWDTPQLPPIGAVV